MPDKQVTSNVTLPSTLVLPVQQIDLSYENAPRELPWSANVSNGEIPVLKAKKTKGPPVEC